MMTDFPISMAEWQKSWQWLDASKYWENTQLSKGETQSVDFPVQKEKAAHPLMDVRKYED